MFSIWFKDVDNSLVNGILRKLDDLDIMHLVYTTYEKTKDFLDNKYDYNVNNIFINLENQVIDDFDVDDCMISILDASRCPVVKLPIDTELKDLFIECAELYQLSYLDYDVFTLSAEPTLNHNMDYFIIDEIFNGLESKSVMYSPVQFATKIIVDSDYVYIENIKFDLITFDWATIFKYIDYDFISNVSKYDNFLSHYLISQIPLVMIPKEQLLDRINEYKIKLFYKTMELTARDISKLPMKVVNIFTIAGYVPLKHIKSFEERIEKLAL